jgi:spore maturation protein CgeB
VFEPRHAAIAAAFDLIAYTDTGLERMHREFGFAAQAAYVPLGATRAGAVPPVRERDPDLVFVAAPTANRTELLAGIRAPLRIVGPNWHREPGIAHHRLDSKKVGARALVRYYARYRGVLNIRHGVYVVNGLNQRHFAPYVMGAPVVSDAQPDIPECFEPGREIFVWRDAAELEALYAELRADPARAAAVGAAGQRRVLAQHTYAHRLISLARLAGVKA